MEHMLDKIAVLKQYFGHASFRAGQETVVDALLKGQDALCVMPTGAGKSVCYQVPALMLEGITLVISPLISLMKDQVSALTQNGIAAAYINSSLTPTQVYRVIEGLRRGAYKIVYVAPERLAVEEFVDTVRALKVSLIAVDEAHCISQWGQDFRPSYLQISHFVEALPTRPIIAAFTATATAEVKDDIEYSLKLRSPLRITTGFDRPGLHFAVKRSKYKLEDLLAIIGRHTGESGIVYCSTRRAVEEVGEQLTRAGLAATIYHAGLEAEVRRRNQEDFVYDRKSIMVATNAFGMGIDKSNVSFVIHYNMPQDVESYYQEAGRAGRDGSDAECVLLYSPRDVHTAQFLINSSEPNPQLTPEEVTVLKERAHERLKRMVFYATSSTCLRRYMLNYFGEDAPNYCGNCSNCLTQYREVDATVDAQKVMSCIKRTGERYGKKMICDILRGSKNERLLSLGLDHQTTYGLMASYTEPQLRELIDTLEFEGYLETRGLDYPTLALTSLAHRILFEGERFVMKQVKPQEASEKKSKKKEKDYAIDHELFAKLKALRRTIADVKGVPAYVVFADATLIDMCRRRPTTEAELLEVAGVGRTKLEQYGEKFLSLLREHPAAPARVSETVESDGADLAADMTEADYDDFAAYVEDTMSAVLAPAACDALQATEPPAVEETTAPPRLPALKRADRPPFSITPEQISRFEPDPAPITTKQLARQLDSLVEAVAQKRMRRLKYRRITQWLLDVGLLEWGEWGSKARPFPTALGKEMGLAFYIFRRDKYQIPVIQFSEEAQRFVVDNIDAVLATKLNARQADEETEEDGEEE